MGTPAEHVALLKNAYRQWDESKGRNIKAWLDLLADDFRLRSLAAGRPGVEFTSEVRSKAEVQRYFEGLAADWEMIDYQTDDFVAEGERVAVCGSTAWRNRKTGRVVDTPKADFWIFKDGKAVELREFYNTAALVAAAQP